MNKKISDIEIEQANTLANEVADRISSCYMEHCISSEYCQVEVLLPITENINMEFMIDVPKEMRDEDNTTLLEYFRDHIYTPKDKYMTESINAAIVERDAALKRLEENVKNFDPDIFFKEFGAQYDPPCPIDTLLQGDFDGDLLDTPINGDYLIEMVIGHDTPIRWKYVNNKIHIIEKVSVTDRETEVEYYILQGSDITSIYIFAGNGGKRVFRNAWLYAKKYGGEEKDWFHARGKCFVVVDDDQSEVDLHWCEAPDVGAVSREIKEWYDMKDRHENQMTNINESGVLTEAGIMMENGETVKTGKAVELARKCQKLLNDNKLNEFMDFVCDSPEVKNLPDDQLRLLLGTKVTEKNMNILDISFHIEVMNSPAAPEE